MSQSPLSPAPSETKSTHKRRIWTVMGVVGFVAMALFVTTEILVLFGAATWAISGLAHFGVIGTAVVATILGIPSLLAIVKSIQLAFHAEMDPASD